MEIVVVDGASTDRTIDQIKKYNSEINRWISEPDRGPYDGMRKAAKLAKGRWIIFMNAGDFFYTKNALKLAIKNAPSSADFIFGHHIYRYVDGREIFQVANNFDETWRSLKSGKLSFQWISGVPGHQATLTKTSSLRSSKGYDFETYPMAADHEFMYRMRRRKAKFFHCNEIIAIYTGGGVSAQNEIQSHRDWWRIARKYGPPRKVDLFFRSNYSAETDISPLWRNLRKFPLLGSIALFVKNYLPY